MMSLPLAGALPNGNADDDAKPQAKTDQPRRALPKICLQPRQLFISHFTLSPSSAQWCLVVCIYTDRDMCQRDLHSIQSTSYPSENLLLHHSKVVAFSLATHYCYLAQH